MRSTPFALTPSRRCPALTPLEGVRPAATMPRDTPRDRAGVFEQLPSDEIAQIANLNGTSLSEQTVRVVFDAPRIAVGRLCFEITGPAAQPPVVLCTTYLGDKVMRDRCGCTLSSSRTRNRPISHRRAPGRRVTRACFDSMLCRAFGHALCARTRQTAPRTGAARHSFGWRPFRLHSRRSRRRAVCERVARVPRTPRHAPSDSIRWGSGVWGVGLEVGCGVWGMARGVGSGVWSTRTGHARWLRALGGGARFEPRRRPTYPQAGDDLAGGSHLWDFAP